MYKNRMVQIYFAGCMESCIAKYCFTDSKKKLQQAYNYPVSILQGSYPVG